MNEMSHGHVCLGQRGSSSEGNGMERLEKKVCVGNSHLFIYLLTQEKHLLSFFFFFIYFY